jgi:molybdate transport system substrate-binding protein
MSGLAALMLLAACGGPGGSAPTSPAPSPGTVVLVSAAASLTDVFGEMEASFERSHAGVDVVLNVAGSSTLREQILQGAPVDVFASANQSNMEQVVVAGLVSGEPVTFARNLLQIAVPPGNPAGVVGLQDFGRDELLLGLCAAGVPCGDLARDALENAGVTPSVDTYEPDVRALLTKIEAGELDGGITYLTDVISARGTVDGVDIPAGENVVTDYPIATLTGGASPVLAADFMAFVLSDEGRAILSRHGFAAP